MSMSEGDMSNTTRVGEMVDDDVCRDCRRPCMGHATRSYRAEGERGVLTNIQCETCFEFRLIAQYRKDGILRTRLVMSAALWGHWRTERWRDRGSALENWRGELRTMRSAPLLHVPEDDWPLYRRRLDNISDGLPAPSTLHSQIAVEDLIVKGQWEALWAEREFGVFDKGGNPVPQPRSYASVNESMERVTSALKTVYEPDCWFGGLATFVRPEPVKGHSGEAEGLKMLSYCMAGRAVQTLSIGDASITLITAEDEDVPRMGVQGIAATEERAIEMLVKATDLWKSGALKLSRDTDVGMF